MHQHQTRIRRAGPSSASLLNFKSGVWSETALAGSLSLARFSMDSRSSSPNSSASSSKSNFSPLGRSIVTRNSSVDDLAPPPPPAATTAPVVQWVHATARTRTPPRQIQYTGQVMLSQGRYVASDALSRQEARRNAREGRSDSIGNLSVLYEARNSNSHLSSSGSGSSAGSVAGRQPGSGTNDQLSRVSRLPPRSTQQQTRTRSLPNLNPRQTMTRSSSFNSLYDISPPARLLLQRSMPNLRARPPRILQSVRTSTASSTHGVAAPLRRPPSSAHPGIVPRQSPRPASTPVPTPLRRRTRLANGLSRVTRGLSDRLLRRTVQRGR